MEVEKGERETLDGVGFCASLFSSSSSLSSLMPDIFSFTEMAKEHAAGNNAVQYCIHSIPFNRGTQFAQLPGYVAKV